ncbi:hypothetical protein AAMO2058_001039500 [Amorphochlora amoebiformis]
METLDEIVGLSGPGGREGATESKGREGIENGKPSKYISGLVKKVVDGVRASNDLPDEREYDYFTTFPKFSGKAQHTGSQILALIDRLRTYLSDDSKIVPLGDHPNVSSIFNQVKDSSELALENVDLKLDELRGAPSSGIAKDADSRDAQAAKRHKGHQTFFSSSSAMMKPQLKFKDKMDNSKRPFVPKINFKPNAISPLPDYSHLKHPAQEEVSVEMQQHLEAMGNSATVPDSAQHPYEEELKAFKPSKSLLSRTKERMFLPLNQTSCHWVDTVSELEDLAKTLIQEKEYAVDLEHHSYRSYQGFTCLMQVSTRKEDYIIDTLALRDKMHVLNDAFTNPKILKVLHGADSDIVWLQKDFGIYVVNMFDTGQAARVLELKSFGLAHLLKHYADVKTDKKYQKADWRVRPVPAEMVMYARQDTHYLLYIYDRLRNSALDRGRKVLESIINRSNQICFKTYEKPTLSAHDITFLVRKFHLHFTEPQFRAFGQLMRWRDDIARKKDESVAFVLPLRQVIAIAKELPLDHQGLVSCCKPMPPLIRDNSQEVLSIMTRCMEDNTLEFSPLDMAAKAQGRVDHLSLDDSRKHLKTPSLDRKKHLQSATPKDDTPVRPTEQLYRDANWLPIQESKLAGAGGSSMEIEGHAPEIKGGIPMFDIRGLVKTAKEHAEKLFQVSIASASLGEGIEPESREFSGNLFDISDDDNEEGEKKAAAVRESIISSVSEPKNSSPQAAAIAMFPDDKKPATGESASSSPQFPNPVVGVTEYGASAKTPNKKKEGDGGDVKTPIDPKVRILGQMVSPATAEEMPRSIREIYKLSNKNKRKNKRADKTGQGKGQEKPSQNLSGNLPATVPFPEVENPTSLSSAKATSKSARDISSQQFMRDIGWLQQGEEISISRPRPNSNKSSNSSNRRGSQNRGSRNSHNDAGKRSSSKPPAFDYDNQSHEYVGSASGPSQSHYNPYGDADAGSSRQQSRSGSVRSYSYRGGRGGRGKSGGRRKGRAQSRSRSRSTHR